jgi:hypothetical protein
MFRRIKNNLVSRVSPTGEHLSGLRADFRSRLGHFRRFRSAPDQTMLTEDFNRVLMAWGISDAASIPGVTRALRLRFLVFAVPVLVCVIAALLLRDFASCLALALVALPCLLGILTTAWRISVLADRRFLPLSRWVLSVFGVLEKRP